MEDELFDGWQNEGPSEPPAQPTRCDECQQRRSQLFNVGSDFYPQWLCGTCLHRKQRRANTYEMWGHGRRGY